MLSARSSDIPFLRFSRQQMLVQQPGQKPIRSVVDTDDGAYIGSGPSVIPGTAMVFLQEHPAGEFGEKDGGHIETAPGDRRKAVTMMGKGTDDGCRSVDGKHNG